jgi:hypothetical protein
LKVLKLRRGSVQVCSQEGIDFLSKGCLITVYFAVSGAKGLATLGDEMFCGILI